MNSLSSTNPLLVKNACVDEQYYRHLFIYDECQESGIFTPFLISNAHFIEQKNKQKRKNLVSIHLETDMKFKNLLLYKIHLDVFLY